jgi:hypothetical protein
MARRLALALSGLLVLSVLLAAAGGVLVLRSTADTRAAADATHVEAAVADSAFVPSQADTRTERITQAASAKLRLPVLVAALAALLGIAALARRRTVAAAGTHLHRFAARVGAAGRAPPALLSTPL